MFDGHIIHFLLSKLNVHAAIPGVTAEYTLLLRKLILFFYCFYIEEHMVDWRCFVKCCLLVFMTLCINPDQASALIATKTQTVLETS